MNDELWREVRTGINILIGLCLTAFLIFAFVFPPAIAHREASRSSGSKNNLKQIGLALHSYHDLHQMLPPGKIVTEEGNDYRGWPVMILPFLDESPLYERIDANQPFDAPRNSSVFQEAELIRSFLNPMSEDYDISNPNLHYALNSRVFLPNRGMKFSEVTDGTGHTFMGGEISEGLRPWFEPGHLRDPAKGFNKGPETFGSPYFGQKKYKGVHMLMMDGSVQTFSDDIDPAVLKALATPAAGDDTKGYPSN